MPFLTEQTVHEDELMHGPADRLDDLLGNTAVAVQQGHVRRVCLPPVVSDPNFPHRRTQNLLKRHQRGDTIAATQDQRMVSRSAEETRRAVERDLERRHYNGCRRFGCPRDIALRQTHVIAEVMQGDMKTLRCERSAFQSMFDAQMPRKLCDARGGILVREDREKQRIRQFWRGIEPR